MTARTELDISEVLDRGRVSLDLDGTPVVVLTVGDRFVAYVDRCVHQGGPVCSKGSLHPVLTARVGDDGRPQEYFAEGGETVIACPWHGWEYDLHTGVCLADRTKVLRSAAVEVVDDRLVVTL